MVSVLSGQRDRFRSRATQLEEQLTQVDAPGCRHLSPCVCMPQSLPHSRVSCLLCRGCTGGVRQPGCACRLVQRCRQRRRQHRQPRRTTWPLWSGCATCRASALVAGRVCTRPGGMLLPPQGSQHAACSCPGPAVRQRSHLPAGLLHLILLCTLSACTVRAHPGTQGPRLLDGRMQCPCFRAVQRRAAMTWRASTQQSTRPA